MLFRAAPGPVSYPIIHRGYPIVLAWGAPLQPNGVIIKYEVTYRINDQQLLFTNVGLNTTFIIPGQTLGATISNISITAYTRVGRGEATSLPDTRIPEQCEFSEMHFQFRNKVK